MLVFTLDQVKAGALTPIFRCDAVGGYSDRIWGPDERDELLRLATQVGGIGIFETDFERDRSRFSPELCAILGLPAGAEMTYAEAILLYHGPDRIAAIARAEAAVHSRERGRWSSMHRIKRPDGVVRWISLQGRRIYRDTNHGPIPVRSIGTVVDITHILEAQEALRENERRLRLALDAARMGTFEVDLAGTTAVIDAQEARLLGLPEDTRIVSVEKLRERVPPQDREESDAKQKRLTEHNEAYEHEFRLRLPDGNERWLRAYADVRSDRIFGVNFDVTERRHAEIALRNSEARLRIATSGAALGIFEWHPLTDHVVWENDRMYEIFGRTHADGPVGKRQLVSDYLHPDDVQSFEAGLQNSIQTGGTLHTVCRIKHEDQAFRWVQIDAKFETAATEQPLRLVGVIADVTERKRLEQEAKKLSERLIDLQEQERQRIAQELHDSTAQHLVAVDLNLSCLRPRAGLSDEEIKRWDQTEASLQEAIKEIRTFSYLMHPPALQTAGLCATIDEYVAGFGSRSKLDVSVRLNPDIDRLAFELQRSLLRIAQEALANVHHHANASSVGLAIRMVSGCVHLIVRDNGQGRKGNSDRPTFGCGRGVTGMRARAEQHGGTLRLRTGCGGTSVHVAMPAGLVHQALYSI